MKRLVQGKVLFATSEFYTRAAQGNDEKSERAPPERKPVPSPGLKLVSVGQNQRP